MSILNTVRTDPTLRLAAIQGLLAQRTRIDQLLQELDFQNPSTKIVIEAKRRVLSAAGRARIAAAQKKRWAKHKKKGR